MMTIQKRPGSDRDRVFTAAGETITSITINTDETGIGHPGSPPIYQNAGWYEFAHAQS